MDEFKVLPGHTQHVEIAPPPRPGDAIIALHLLRRIIGSYRISDADISLLGPVGGASYRCFNKALAHIDAHVANVLVRDLGEKALALEPAGLSAEERQILFGNPDAPKPGGVIRIHDATPFSAGLEMRGNTFENNTSDGYRVPSKAIAIPSKVFSREWAPEDATRVAPDATAPNPFYRKGP